MHENLAHSTVSGHWAKNMKSFGVATGSMRKFPSPPFNAVIWPAGDKSPGVDAEIVRVTSIHSGYGPESMMVVRAQEGTDARTLRNGDNVAAVVVATVMGPELDLAEVVGGSIETLRQMTTLSQGSEDA